MTTASSLELSPALPHWSIGTIGPDRALELVEDANVRESHLLIRWVWLDRARGASEAPGVPPDRIQLATADAVTHVRAPTADGNSLFTYVRLDIPDARPAAIELRESLAPDVIGGQAEIIREAEPSGSPAHESAVVISTQIRRVTGIIRQLLDFARRRSPQKERQDLRDVTEQAVSLLASMARRGGTSLAFSRPPEPVNVDIDAGQIQQAITNLMVNGIQAMPGGGQLTISLDVCRRTPPPEPGGPEALFARLTIADRGRGMAPATLERIFEPFFTTKDIGEGTGLGLSVTYGIVSEHGGWIDVRSTVGAGSTFCVHLPADMS